MYLSRGLSAPNTLQEAITLSESVQRIVGLGPRSNKAAQRICLVLACVPAVLVDLADRDLHGCVVLRFDDAVGRAAFAWYVPVFP